VVAAAKRADKVGGLKVVYGEIEVDHIVSRQRMTEMEGFGRLYLAQCRALAVRSDNLITHGEGGGYGCYEPD
jgi:hypothetical protein